MSTLERLQEYVRQVNVVQKDTPVGVGLCTDGKWYVLMSLGNPCHFRENLVDVLAWIDGWLDGHEAGREFPSLK